MPIINMQRRARQLGRIRIGNKETFTKRDGSQGTRPAKLDRFRLTSASQPLLEKVAELYGGEVQPWTPDGGTPQFEVITAAKRLPIMVPPQPVSQWYEYWTRAGCQHRCDGEHNVLTDEPCDPDDPAHVEATKRPTTRLNVVLRDVEGIGVWRVETHGWNAALELPDVAEFLAHAGGYVNGWLSLEERTSIDTSGAKPVTQRFMVPIIEIDVTPSQLMAGGGRVAAPALAGGPVGERPALVAAGPDYVALAEDITSLEELQALWRQAHAGGHLTEGLMQFLTKRAQDFQGAPAPVDAAAAGEPVQGEVVKEEPSAAPGEGSATAAPVDDPDLLWHLVVAEAGKLGMTTPQLNADFEQQIGVAPGEAAAPEMQAYLHVLKTGEVA